MKQDYKKIKTQINEKVIKNYTIYIFFKFEETIEAKWINNGSEF